MKILWIEDEGRQLNLYGMIVKYVEGATADGVEPERALDVDWREYDLVFLDLMMGEYAGEKVLAEALTRWGELPPVVIFSALGESYQRSLVRQSVPVDGDRTNVEYVVKSQPKGLVDCIRAIVERHLENLGSGS